MGRPFHPEQGLNRQLLLALRRQPGQAPGTLARTLRYDGAVVREQLGRLAAAGLVTITPGDRFRTNACSITPEGEAVLRRRYRTRTPARAGA
jgi:DNA-binding MarR family transcriptional regulator